MSKQRHISVTGTRGARAATTSPAAGARFQSDVDEIRLGGRGARQWHEVVAFRNGAEALDNAGEAVAAILAQIDRTIGVAEKEAVAARPAGDAHRLDIALRGLGNALREQLPIVAVIAAAEDGRAGIMRLAPDAGMTRGARHEERLLIGREADVIGIGEAEFLASHLLPMRAGIHAAIGAAAHGHEHALRLGWRDEDLMQILEGAMIRPRIIGELAPALAAIEGLEHRALLDRGIEMLRIARVDGEHFGMRDMRRRREGPVLVLLLADRRQLLPAFAEIEALEERGRLGASIDDDLAAIDNGGKRVNVFEPQAVLARFPILPVVTPEDTIAMRAGEDSRLARQQRHRADVMAFECRRSKLPGRARRGALQGRDALCGRDEQAARLLR